MAQHWFKLFHYFMEYTQFEKNEWDAYKRVNEKFAKVIIEQINDGDTVWVHDYQLLLLPQLIKEKKPNTTIEYLTQNTNFGYNCFVSRLKD